MARIIEIMILGRVSLSDAIHSSRIIKIDIDKKPVTDPDLRTYGKKWQNAHDDLNDCIGETVFEAMNDKEKKWIEDDICGVEEEETAIEPEAEKEEERFKKILAKAQ